MSTARRIERMAPTGEDPVVPQTHYFGTTKTVNLKPVWTGKVVQAPDHILTLPLRWKRPRRIFVNSMSDLFHESIPDEWIERVFEVMRRAKHHTFQVLTKRSARMREWCNGADPDIAWPLPNVWLGVSAEDQQRADERIPDLLATPAAVRFVSCEPLLGAIDLTNLPAERIDPEQCGAEQCCGGHMRLNALDNSTRWCEAGAASRCSSEPVSAPSLDWVIVGGESGSHARPMHPRWARDLRDQCKAAGVPFYFKQWGSWLPGQNDPWPTDNARKVAHWQDGGWGPRDVSRGLASRNYVMWESDGTLHVGGSRGRDEYFPVAAWAQRVGKRAAGRLLDGVEHSDFPEVRT
jgi:protein gp37